MIAGGIVGAAIGNAIGSGDGRPLATLAGGVIGSALGHEAGMRRARDYGDGRERYRESSNYVVQRCGVRYENRVEQRPDGYRVTYLFAGRRHEIHLPYDPGDWLPVTAMPRWRHQDNEEGEDDE